MIKLLFSRETSMKQDVLNINSAIIGFWRQGASPELISRIVDFSEFYVRAVIRKYKEAINEGVAE